MKLRKLKTGSTMLHYFLVLPFLYGVAYDAKQAITKKELYDLKAIPTLYLLDKNKRVILKDASVEQIEAWARTPNT